MRLGWLVVVAACGSTSRAPYKAGDEHDEGAGLLANASATLQLGDATPDKLADTTRTRAGAAYGGDPYGGSMYGGDPYGGTPQVFDLQEGGMVDRKSVV